MVDTYIEECIVSRSPVRVITINGFQMYGVIIADDSEIIVLATDDCKKLVYKHAISTIEPAKKVNKTVK